MNFPIIILIIVSDIFGAMYISVCMISFLVHQYINGFCIINALYVCM